MKQLESQVVLENFCIIRYDLFWAQHQAHSKQTFFHLNSAGAAQKPSTDLKLRYGAATDDHSCKGPACKAGGENNKKTSRILISNSLLFPVGAARFERATSCSQSRCATWLRHAPTVSAEIEQRRVTGKKKSGKRRTHVTWLKVFA